MSWRTRLRGVGERVLVASGVPRVTRARLRSDVLVLAYHNIVPAGAEVRGDRSLHLPLAAFTAQLDWLAARYEVVPLEHVLRESGDARHAPPRRPRVVITFDDAYRGAVTVGVPELVARGLPATFFVAPAFVGGRSFWWDALALPGEAELDPEMRRHALHECRGEDAAVRQWARDMGRMERPVPEHAWCVSEAELCTAAHQPGISLGSHTWSHANLARLAEDELREELVRSLAWLRERVARMSGCLSYPYGSYSRHVARAAADAGYDAALRIDGGWMCEPAADRFALPRLNVPAGLSRNGFILRTAGLLCR
jgi:peptidoglycan/xylan/chitin deacetylase (PgdA/CDA1 family)